MPSITHAIGDLPAPAPEALAHSGILKLRIREAIRLGDGGISFAEFMRLALYAPGLGYYSAGARKFGAAGDFVTAPELAPLFSACYARQCAEILAALSEGSILELGAGSGVMAADMLTELARLGFLPREYLILEVSADLKERQRETLSARVPELLGRVRWLETLPERFTGVVVSNELVDALPAERFRKTLQGWERYCVTEDGEGFAWTTRRADSGLMAELNALESTLPSPLAPDYTSEICTSLKPLMRSLDAAMVQGAVLFVDYGHTRAAYYHPDRSMGTLMCYYRQRAHEDPFLYPGLQDITAHVDFTALAEAGTGAGFKLAGYNTQAHFLLSLGLVEAAGNSLPALQEVKLLTLPEEMGERFKAMGFTKGLAMPLSGFALRDLSHTL